MSNFFDLMNNIDKEKERDRLIQLAESVYCTACQQTPDMSQLRSRLEDLLVFLCSPKGRTDESCHAVDTYLSTKNDWPSCIEHLPRDVYDILVDIGGTLHDAIQCPDIAANFESLPEQLLDRVRKLNV